MKLSARDITYCSIMAALTFLSGFLIIPLGPIPLTLQTLFVLLTGLILSKRNALLSQGIHLLLALLIGGFQALLSPSFGFVFGFTVGAYVIAFILEKYGFTAKIASLAVLIGSIVIYSVGLPYMAIILNSYLGGTFSIVQILQMGLFIFIPGDLFKAITAVVIGLRLQGKVARAQSHIN
ncbi:biotin transporter BioY [Carnobacterium funditum]|uniref:biotin transporter BioY n=1 Tax=Carnobacterium funditum TaxID=2752 RepID=UPI000B088250|nr:biotin transporter BioY [Carnobacterium funditum]